MTASEFLALWHDPRPYVESLTSGSTGVPKTVRLAKADMVRSARRTNAFFGLGAGSRFVCPMDFRYIGARMMAVRAVVAGGELVEVPPSNFFRFDGVADLLAVVPSQVPCLLDNPDMLVRTRHLIIGGAPLHPDLASRLAATGVDALTTYGMTETVSHVALARVGDDTYRALPGITFSVDDRSCLVIGPLVTNDVVRLVSPTAFQWLGRADNVINSGGVKIHPEEVEAVLRPLLRRAGIRADDIVVVGVPSRKWGSEAVGVVESDTAPDADSVRRLVAMARAAGLSPHKTPRRFVATPRIPRTPNGKIDRTAW